MGNPRQLASVMLLSACAAAAGCAQWQQDPDVVAASFDDRVLAKFGAILGEPTPPAPASLRRVAAKPTNVHLASSAEPVMPLTEDVEAPAAEPIANAATPRLAAPAPYGNAARSPVQHCDACCDAHSPRACDATCPVLAACGHCGGCLAGRRCRLLSRPQPGPPPVRYQPCLPPKFLPVPTQPVLSPARPDAPDPWRGDVELGWRTQVTFPARD